MTEYLEYYVARFNLRSDQLKMLQLVFIIQSDRIRKFCLNSLIKDKILQKMTKPSPALKRAIADENPDTYFIHIIEKYVYGEKHNLPYDDDDYDEKLTNEVNMYVKNFFYELLENYSNEISAVILRDNDNVFYKKRFYGTIILNTLLAFGFFELNDAAQLEVTKEDFL